MPQHLTCCRVNNFFSLSDALMKLCFYSVSKVAVTPFLERDWQMFAPYLSMKFHLHIHSHQESSSYYWTTK